ncbi:hypothetical protein [Cellulosimicrobium sp. Marseille-Q4280]|uniref:hypothetical protein n=1 Tax=Cellulosimicrobium sp. Marseille-Q4280 TaxID=2937992 RepID=UPI002041E6DA|nr:hypothetical protein [Cellulosimicrobium sp. Marseille-Q4280]
MDLTDYTPPATDIEPGEAARLLELAAAEGDWQKVAAVASALRELDDARSDPLAHARQLAAAQAELREQGAVSARLAAAKVDPTPLQALAESFHGATLVDRIGIDLMLAWAKADPRSIVAQHPTSFVATFADMSRAVVDTHNGTLTGVARLVHEYIETGGQAYEIVRADRALTALFHTKPTKPEDK